MLTTYPCLIRNGLWPSFSRFASRSAHPIGVWLVSLVCSKVEAHCTHPPPSLLPPPCRDTDGVRVIPVSDIPNPYKDQSKFDTRFIHALSKLYAWSLLEYTRVVMLDADNMFLQNADEQFTCGDFCAVFIHPCVLHTGLFVLKVSPPTYPNLFPGFH